MTTRTFDPSTLIAATREAFAPVLKAQQEGFRTFERLARLHYAVAGDVLESSLARVNAAFVANTPSELFSSTKTVRKSGLRLSTASSRISCISSRE
jgi:hypothetical protein